MRKGREERKFCSAPLADVSFSFIAMFLKRIISPHYLYFLPSLHPTLVYNDCSFYTHQPNTLSSLKQDIFLFAPQTPPLQRTTDI